MTDALEPAEPQPLKRGRGRPKGSKNKVSKEAQDFCRRLTKDATYRKKFKEDWKKRKVPPQIEALVWAYGHGKPVEQVNVSGDAEQAPTAFVLIVDGKALTPNADGSGDS
jgi:hypothetical protein